MEGLVAEMEVKCKNKKHGCKMVMARKSLAAHLEDDCEFSPTKIDICKIFELGCDFSGGRGDCIFNHFMEEHEPLVVYIESRLEAGTPFKLHFAFGNFFELVKTGKANSTSFAIVELPITGPPEKFLICFQVNSDKGYVSVVCLNLEGDGSTREMGVAMELRGKSDKNVCWGWTGNPTHYTKVEQAVRNPLFKVQISNMLEMLGDSGEKLKCNINFFKC